MNIEPEDEALERSVQVPSSFSGCGYQFLFLLTHQCPSLCPVVFSWFLPPRSLGTGENPLALATWRKKRLEGRHHSLHGTNSHPPSKRWFCGWEDGFSQLVWYKLNIFMEVPEKCNGHHESWVSSGCYWHMIHWPKPLFLCILWRCLMKPQKKDPLKTSLFLPQATTTWPELQLYRPGPVDALLVYR